MFVFPNALTPSFKSSFGKHFALSYERSISTPDLRIKHDENVPSLEPPNLKRNLSSPEAEAEAVPKKTKSSLIPKKKGKED